MSKWDKYRVVEPQTVKVNRWDKYKVQESPKQEIKGDSWLPLIGKSALKGISAIADVPRLVGSVGEGIVNLGRKTKGSPIEQYWAGMQNPSDFSKSKIEIDKTAPQTNYSEYIPSTDEIRSGIKKHTGVELEPQPTSPAQRIVSRGIDFGSSMTPWNLPAKGPNLFSKFKNVASKAKEATAVGLGSGTLQETGANPFASDLASSVLTPRIKPNLTTAFQKGKELPAKLAIKAMGLGPERINLKAAQAAKDLGINLPAAVLTDSTLTGLADQTVSKTPILGNVLKDKYNKVQNKIYNNLRNIYDEVGPVKTPEIEKKIFDLYEKRRLELPTNAAIKPIHAVEALDKIKINTAIPSPEETKLLHELGILKNQFNPTVKSNFGDIKIPIQDFNVDKLIGTKQSLNNIIKWDISEGVRNQLRKVQKGISKDIEEYGKTNPKWYKSYKDADELFAKTAKREKLETLLRNEGLNEPEDLSYAMLSRSINDKKKNKLIKKHTSPETFEKINKLGIVANAIVQKNRRVPNPSGTAATASALTFLTGLYLNPAAAVTGTGAFGVLGGTAVTKLLTDKKFLDLALKYAEDKGKSKLSTAMELNKRAKFLSGYTLNSIYRAANRQMNKEGNDELQLP